MTWQPERLNLHMPGASRQGISTAFATRPGTRCGTSSLEQGSRPHHIYPERLLSNTSPGHCKPPKPSTQQNPVKQGLRTTKPLCNPYVNPIDSHDFYRGFLHNQDSRKQQQTRVDENPGRALYGQSGASQASFRPSYSPSPFLAGQSKVSWVNLRPEDSRQTGSPQRGP